MSAGSVLSVIYRPKALQAHYTRTLGPCSLFVLQCSPSPSALPNCFDNGANYSAILRGTSGWYFSE